MPVDWNELQAVMHPMRDYDAMCKRWRDAFAYPFVCETYNCTLPEMTAYTQRLLGEDARNRYEEYAQLLVTTIQQLDQAGVSDILDLVYQVDTRDQFEAFTEKTEVPAREIISVLKYLVYWFIPTKKYLSSLVRKDASIVGAIQVLRNIGIRANLDILQRGLTAAARQEVAEESGLPVLEIKAVANWADFSRMPWASKATISNIIGAGYGSIADLANANPEQLYQDFMAYGASIGKNLKFGNEIESSYRIAKIIPLVLVE